MQNPPMSNNDNITPEMDRRSVLGGIAGLGTLSLSSGYGSAETRPALETTANGADSHHPGEPRFVEVGESLRNSIYVDSSHVFDRDNLAPRITDIQADPENFSADDFQWSVAETPEGSSGDVLGFETDDEDGEPRWDDGTENVAEFTADAPGRYVLEVDAPDGTHRMTLHAFPATPDSAGGPPRISLDAEYDGGAGEFVIESNATLAPNSNAHPDDVTVEFLADDRDDLSTDDITVDGTMARVPESAIGGDAARVHAAAHDGDAHSMADTVVLDADGEVHLPNRPPEWMKEGVMYEIFTRSFAGERGETDMQFLTEKVSYLDELGIDAVWLTPIYPSVSSSKEMAGGGPHGYDATDYMAVAPDLGTLDEYKTFIETCNEHDIKVVFDMVINHNGRDHPYFQDTIESQGDEPPAPDWEFPPVESWNKDSKYFDWFDRMDAPITLEGETIEPAPSNTGFWGLRLQPNWNFDNMALREHMLAVADFWCNQVGVDGFRCDIAWGTPHSFWKEVRDLVRGSDSEFLMLDESIPKDPHFTENEFDMHFDTGEFMMTTHGVGRNNDPAEELIEKVNLRKNEGFPDHTLLINSTENHDEWRLLNEILRAESRENPKKIQRAAWAAGVALPGVPFVYYGQERALSEYGESRHMGEDDPRSGDIQAGRKKRAFMNWDEYDEEHLQFYKDMIATYHDMDVLKPDAAMIPEWYATDPKADPNLLVFGRDASDLENVDGPETVVVVINFEDDPAEVQLRPAVSGTDVITGEDKTVPHGAEATVTEVDTIAIYEAPSLLPVGDTVFQASDETGDDIGPGQPDADDGTQSYAYPTGDDYYEQAFDIDSFKLQETEDSYQFNFGIATDLKNPRDFDSGVSVQHLQVYVRDGQADGGATSARTGVNAEFADPYHYRVVADGENGARLEDADGNEISTGEVKVNNAVNEIVAEIPKYDIDVPVDSMEIAPLMLGYDGSADGGVVPVESEAGADAFGGAENGSAPNVVDMLVHDNTTQAEALSYSEGQLAQLSYVPVTTQFEEVVTLEDETGDGLASGQYTMGTADAFYENAWDIESFTIEESRSRVRFTYTMAEELQNPWSLNGFSHQFFQIYINSPNAEVSGGTEGRDGTNVTTAQPYHYRVVAHPEGLTSVEAANGDGVSTDVTLESEGDTVTISVPTSAIDWSFEETGVAVQPTVMPFDGTTSTALRAINESASEYALGGASGSNAPAALDIFTLEGENQADILSNYSGDSKVALPLVPLGDFSGGGGGGGGSDDSSDDGSGDGDDDGGSGDGSDGLPGFGVAAGAAGVAGAAAAASRMSDADEDDEE